MKEAPPGAALQVPADAFSLLEHLLQKQLSKVLVCSVFTRSDSQRFRSVHEQFDAVNQERKKALTQVDRFTGCSQGCLPL